MAECASRFVQPVLLYHLRPYSTAYDGLVPVTSIINKKDAPIDQSNGGSLFSDESDLFSVDRNQSNRKLTNAVLESFASTVGFGGKLLGQGMSLTLFGLLVPFLSHG